MPDVRFDRLTEIEPMVGPLGDDLLLRAIHAGLLGDSTPRTNDHLDAHIRRAPELRLIRVDEKASDKDYLMVRATDFGALYWESRGAKFSDFVYNCPPVEDLAWQGGEAPRP